MKLAEDKGCELSGLTADDLKPLSEFFEADVAEVWSFEKSAEMRDSEGGTSSRSVHEQVGKLRAYLAVERERM